MKDRKKEVNETVNACIIIQNQMNDCENTEELTSIYDAWVTLITEKYKCRYEELSKLTELRGEG